MTDGLRELRGAAGCDARREHGGSGSEDMSCRRQFAARHTRIRARIVARAGVERALIRLMAKGVDR
jgi:hypothetical protein